MTLFKLLQVHLKLLAQLIGFFYGWNGGLQLSLNIARVVRVVQIIGCGCSCLITVLGS